MAHNLLLNYHVYDKMDVYRPPPASEQELTKFHADDYIKFLQMITPQNMANHAKQIQRFNIGDDCPIFDGLYDFCKTSAGGSIAGAVKLNFDKADVAINWAGGLHHAKKCEASGFCFVNDMVRLIYFLLLSWLLGLMISRYRCSQYWSCLRYTKNAEFQENINKRQTCNPDILTLSLSGALSRSLRRYRHSSRRRCRRSFLYHGPCHDRVVS